MLSVPRSLDAISPAWMTAALAARFPGAVVGEIELIGHTRGTNDRAAVALRYASGEGPSRAFVKLHGAPLNRLALIALRAFYAEAELAASGVELPIESPLPIAAGWERRRLATIVVMEDVTLRDGEPNSAARPLNVAQARDGVRQLARLHAAFAGGGLPPALSFVRSWRLSRGWSPISAASLTRGLALARAVDGAEALRHARALTLARQFRLSADLAAGGPQTLLHGDPHLGNTYSLRGGRVGFYDWQLIRSGNWSHDLGYFLVSALTVRDRREHERDLLNAYLAAQREGGGTPPDAAAAWERYRATPAYGLATWLHTLAGGSFQARGDCLAVIERFAAAYADLETASVAALAAGR